MTQKPISSPKGKRLLDEKCRIVFLLLLTLSLTACSPQPLATESVVTQFTVTPSLVTSTVVTADWFQVYFTNPAGPMV